MKFTPFTDNNETHDHIPFVINDSVRVILGTDDEGYIRAAIEEDHYGSTTYTDGMESPEACIEEAMQHLYRATHPSHTTE